MGWIWWKGMAMKRDGHVNNIPGYLIPEIHKYDFTAIS